MPSPDPLGLARKVVIVTGGTRGIGRATADAFAAAGARVVLASRHRDEAERAAAEVAKAFGGDALGVAADVSQLADAESLMTAAKRWGGRIDAVACVAGHPFDRKRWDTPLHETPKAELDQGFEDVWRTDFLGSLHATWAALPAMLEKRSGALVYVGSTPALVGYKGPSYTAAKAAVLGLMRDVAREYGPRGVRANAVAPGNIKTPATWDLLSSRERKALGEEASLRRWGEPEDVARAIVFLASDLARFMTGEVVVVDGGTVMR